MYVGVGDFTSQKMDIIMYQQVRNRMCCIYVMLFLPRVTIPGFCHSLQ